MAEFVRRQKIRLYVLSPKSPKLNGAVERCNPAWRYEFYSVYDLPRNAEAINRILDASITSTVIADHIGNPWRARSSSVPCRAKGQGYLAASKVHLTYHFRSVSLTLYVLRAFPL
jgi:hypothetical protein